MYSDHIEITVYGMETFRKPRLSQIIGYVQALADIYGDHEVLNKISNLHDHKGTMSVTWKTSPTEREKAMFLKAWKSSIGDGADNVLHEF